MIYVIGHKNPDTDSVISAICYSKFLGSGYIPATLGELNNETKFILEKFNIQKPIILTKINDEDRVILVDHNENTQTIDGLKNEQIIEILDHHKINISLPNPINITTKPYGSTASLVTEKFLDAKKEIDKDTASLLLSAILSDTVIFKSPITTEKDRNFASILSEISEIGDVTEYGMQLFKKKADLSSKTSEEIIYNDFKEFDFSGKKIGIGQIELIDSNDILDKKDSILSEMQKVVDTKGLFSIILVVTDIMREGSSFWVVGNKDIIQGIFNIDDDNDYVDGVLSRKKQVVPVLEEKLNQ